MDDNKQVGGIRFTATSTPPVSGAAISAEAHQGIVVDPMKLLSALVKLGEQSLAQFSQGFSRTTNANGAPALEESRLQMSSEDFLLALQHLRTKAQDSQLQTAAEGVNMGGIKKAKQNEARLEKMHESIRLGKEESALEKAGLLAGMTGAIVQFIAAVAAVVVAAAVATVTLGAGVALLVVAGIGLAAASVNLASQINVAQGKEPIDLGKMLVDAITRALVNSGMPEDKASSVGKMLSGLVGTLTLAFLVDPSFGAQFITGFSELVGADANQSMIISAVFTTLTTILVAVAMCLVTGGAAAASAVSGIAKVVTNAGKIAQIVASCVGAAATITQGGYKIAAAHVTQRADQLEMERTQLAAVIAFIQRQMEDEQVEMKKLLQTILEGAQAVSRMLESASQARSQIIANIPKSKI